MTILFILLGAASVLSLCALFYLFLLSSVPNSKLPEKTITVGEDVFTVEIANTTTTRMRGLSGREPFGDDYGMLFVFDSPARYGFWMKDMKFALDFVWIAGDRVVGVTENAPPQGARSLFQLSMYYPPENADRVLEINAGEVARRGIRVGQRVTF